jgi:peptidoglycan/LPS O-acetylase OafA/YrhL
LAQACSIGSHARSRLAVANPAFAAPRGEFLRRTPMTIGYLIKRLFLIIPILLGIMLISFVIVQLAPGGPVEHILARIHAQGLGSNGDSVARPTHEAR